MAKRTILVLLAVIALAGCGGSSSGSDGAGKDSPTTTAAKGSGSGSGGDSECAKYTGGEDGVVRTFCDGNAKATVTVDGTEHTYAGGECTDADGVTAVNIGVVAGSGFTGDVPDYFGANVPSDAGDFGGDGTVVTFVVDGTPNSLRDITGTSDGDSGTFSGTPITGGDAITGTFSC